MPGVFLPLLAASLAPTSGLAAFDPVLGRCWEGAVSETARDVHCFEPVFGGAHLRDRHRVLVDGATVYEGETFYSLEGERVSFTYLTSLGGVGRGTVTPHAQGLCFDGEMRAAPAAAPQPFRICWRWTEDGYVTEDEAGRRVRFTPSGTAF